MKKRLVSIVLAMTMLLGSVPVSTFAEDMASDNGMTVIAETPETVDISEPAAASESTVAPETTATQEPAETPELTAAPESSAMPEPGAASESTAAPETTATPEPAETPELTAAPESAAMPGPAAASESTAAPETTATQEPTEAPKLTAAPESAAMPGPAAVSESTELPKSTVSQEPAGQGDDANGHPADDSPDVTDAADDEQKRAVPTTFAAPGAARDVPDISVGAMPRASKLTYGQTLDQSSLKGGYMVDQNGISVWGTFTWKTPSEKPDAGIHEYDVIFIPTGQVPAIDIGKVQVTVAQAAIIFTWGYDEMVTRYTGSPVSMPPPRVETPDGKPHTGTITYEHKGPGDADYRPGVPQNAGNYYVRATIAAQGNYLGATAPKDLKLIILAKNATLLVEDFARPYNGNAVTLEEIPKMAQGCLGENLKGTWSFQGTVPEMKDTGTYNVTLAFAPEDPNYAPYDKTIRVTVQPADLSAAEVKVAGSYNYNGQAHIPASSDVAVTLNGHTIPESEYELSYENNQNAGQGVVIVKGRHNYTGVAKGEFTIAPTPLTITGITVKSRQYDATTCLSVESLTLDGVLDADKGKVRANLNLLTATVKSADAGIYDTVTLGASMELEGSAKDNYRLPGTEITLTGNQVNGGQGASIEPAVVSRIAPMVHDKVYDSTKKVEVSGIDFSVERDIKQQPPVTFQVECDSSNAGRVKVQGTATLTDDNFIFSNGQMTTDIDPVEITIQPLPVQLQWSGDIRAVYDGKEHSVTATVANRVGDDQVTPVLRDNAATNLGSYRAAVVALEGPDKDNYTLSGSSSLVQTWQIDAVDISNAEVTLSETRYIYDGTEHKPTVTVKLEGKTLIEGEDYSVEFLESTVNIGTVRVVVSGIGNYSGYAYAAYTIEPAPDNTVYYNCPSCGNHDWTATDKGYRCDACGYLESVKQLSGYSNVKGVYTPQTGGAARSTVSVPRTGEAQNFALWGWLMALSGTALGAMGVRRKRKQ